MEKNKIQASILIALLVVCLLVWILPSKRKAVEMSAKDLRGVYYVEEFLPVNDFSEFKKSLEEKKPKIQWGRDPFQLSVDKTEEGELRLSGVAVDEAGKIAIINNEIVREGDMILGAKVVEIKEDYVTIQKDGKTYVLKTYENVE
jgi:hypothetical protein